MFMKFQYIFFLVILFVGCRSKDGANIKAISIFSTPAYSHAQRQNHVVVYLNSNKVADKLTGYSEVSTSVYIKCLFIDSTKSNKILIKINNKSIKIDPSKYHGKCLEIFTTYDNQLKIRNAFHAFEKLSIEKRNIIPDYKKYLDSINSTHPGDKFDTVTYGIQFNKCWCDSAINENK